MSPPFRYKIQESDGAVEVHFVGRRRDVYELFGDYLRTSC
jgi:hypothetical protein